MHDKLLRMSDLGDYYVDGHHFYIECLNTFNVNTEKII